MLHLDISRVRTIICFLFHKILALSKNTKHKASEHTYVVRVRSWKIKTENEIFKYDDDDVWKNCEFVWNTHKITWADWSEEWRHEAFVSQLKIWQMTNHAYHALHSCSKGLCVPLFSLNLKVNQKLPQNRNQSLNRRHHLSRNQSQNQNQSLKHPANQSQNLNLKLQVNQQVKLQQSLLKNLKNNHLNLSL